ncbi:hypothetical protein [Thauera sp. Sel9]|uniref:hypothetical protein n=1 Tax=Thauera sp. Sel9 TaxID=2974299 RepID=UPI0021E10644|nr:hypothetical protein [Thauera sp. Sel9]MCV2218478.1 hypothetical protein [Thauera sp. Sel9]
MNAPDLRLGRVVLRGTAGTIARARAELPAALARSRWPDAGDDAILVLRRVAVSGTLPELPARAAAAAERIASRAADPWSPGADSADAVRFRDALDYRACLVYDLLAGTAARRWLWRHRAVLPALRLADALAAQLAEDALALPALLDHPGLRTMLPVLWRTLDAPAARSLLQAIGAASGWSAAIAAALDMPPDARRMEQDGNPDHGAKRSEASAAHFMMAPPASATADAPPSLAHAPPPAGAGMAEMPAATHPLRSSRQRQTTSARQAIAGLPPNDPRAVLQALLEQWHEAPAALSSARAGRQLHGIAHVLTRCTPATRTAPAPRAVPAVAPPAANAAKPARPRIQDEPALPGSPAPQPPPLASRARPDIPLPPAAEHDFLSRSGGLFFLLNVPDLPALRAWRAALAESRAGWRELVRLASRIDIPIDPPLADFLADACGLDPGSDPLAALAALGPGHDADTVDAAARRFHGDAALAALRIERPARVRASASRVDLHLRLADASLDVRRAGLDIDPGWLPWLGCVVRFHYDRGGFTP